MNVLTWYHRLQIYTLFLDLQAFSCFALVLIHHGGVDLCGGDVAVGEHLAYSIYVGAAVQKEGGVGVPEAVEGDVLRDACCLEPAGKFFLDQGIGESLEYFFFASLATEIEGLVGDGEVSGCLCFLRDDTDAVPAIRILFYLVPGQVPDISETKPGQALFPDRALPLLSSPWGERGAAREIDPTDHGRHRGETPGGATPGRPPGERAGLLIYPAV